MALVPIMNWVQFNSLGGVKSSKSRTVAEPLYVESFVIFGQLHPAFVAFAAGTTWLEDLNWELTLQLGEALERTPRRLLLILSGGMFSPKPWC